MCSGRLSPTGYSTDERQDIPALNAALNALATALMTAGFVFIRQARTAPDESARAAAIARHRTSMISAGVVSAVFLIGYVAHKILVRGVHTPFGGTGAIATVYYTMLISHILLAISIAYLVPRTFLLAFRGITRGTGRGRNGRSRSGTT